MNYSSGEVWKANYLWCLLVILVFSFFSIGAWWGSDKPKKEPQKKTVSEPAFEVIRPEPVSQPVSEIKPPQLSSAKPKEIEPPAVVSGKQLEEIKRIQEELKQIIDRTHKLQADVKENRSEVQNIMERAQIHERILQNIAVPRQTQTVSPVIADEIVKREKLRLIAEQTQRTQQRLRVIQQTRSMKAAQYHSTVGKASETS